MGDVKKFIDDESKHERRLATLMDWKFVESQSKGSSFDYLSKDGSKIEVKFDWGSIISGNHYLETAQTNDNKKTWVPSGFSLSSEDADYWVVINNEWIRVFRIDVLESFLRENRSSLEIKETRQGVNFNHTNSFSRAFIIPFRILDDYCLMKFVSPIQRNHS